MTTLFDSIGGIRSIAMVLAAGILATGCTSNAAGPPGDADGGGSGEPNACMMSRLTATGGGACASCSATSCAPTVQDFQSSCSAYLSCLCPGGSYKDDLASGCQSGITIACTNAGASMTDCETTVCADSCAKGTGPFGAPEAGVVRRRADGPFGGDDGAGDVRPLPGAAGQRVPHRRTCGLLQLPRRGDGLLLQRVAGRRRQGFVRRREGDLGDDDVRRRRLDRGLLFLRA
jgi:hypothetical protein